MSTQRIQQILGAEVSKESTNKDNYLKISLDDNQRLLPPDELIKIVNVGDYAKCPECNRVGRVVWISKDGKTAGIKCPAVHRQTSRPDSRLGSLKRNPSKASRNMVFITKIK